MAYTTTTRGVAVATIVFFLAACDSHKGGSDNNNSGNTTPPLPTFSVGGVITGLTDPGLVLRNNNGDDLLVSAAAGNFAFTTQLASGAYDVTIGAQAAHQRCSIVDGSGVVVGANITSVQVTCTTPWSSGVSMFNSPYETGAKIAFLPNGDAFAFWQHYGNIGYEIYGNRYNASTGTWSTPSLFGAGIDPRIVVSASGDAMVIYGNLTAILARRYDTGTDTWYPPVADPAVLIAGGPGFFPDYDVAIDAAGNAIVVWAKPSSSALSAFARRYDAGTNTWDSSAVLLESVSGDVIYPRAAMDANGNGLAIWVQNNNVYTSRYAVSAGAWDATPTLIKSNTTTDAVYPQIAMDGSGNAIAVWRERVLGFTFFGLAANRYNVGTGTWSGPVYVAAYASLGLSDSRAISDPQIAVSPAGNAIAIWREDYDSRYSVVASRYNAGAGTWDTPMRVDTGNADLDDVDTTYAPQIAMRADGNAIAVWRVSNDGPTQSHIYANGFSATAGAWGTPVRIKTNADSQASPQIGFDADGNGIAIWDQYDAANSQYNIGTAHYQSF